MAEIDQIVIIIGVIYIAFCVLFYFAQDYFFFHPEKLPEAFRYKFPFPFEEVNFEMEDGGTINGIHFKVPNSKGVVFYLKGNTRSVKGWGKFARDFVGKGYDFFMIDYRGFGKSRGRRSEKVLYQDAQFVYEWLCERYEEDQIILYGRSMGSGIAARLASWNTPRMLILDSPYYSFLHQVKLFGFFLPLKYLLRYKIRTDKFIQEVKSPIFILHGLRDRLIPYRFGEKLHKMTPENSKLFTIQDGGHNNLPSFPEYHDFLYDILHDESLYLKFAAKLQPLRLMD